MSPTPRETASPDLAGVRRVAARTFRTRRTLPALIVAAALTLIALLTAVQAGSVLLGRPAPGAGLVGRASHDLRWSDPGTLAASAAVALLGVLLLVLAALPARDRVIALAAVDPARLTGLTRDALCRAVGDAALDVGGIVEARAILRGRLRPRVRVHAVAGARRAADPRPRVEEAVRARLAELAPLRMPRVRVTVRRGRV